MMKGGSTCMDCGVFSWVQRGLKTKAWPPMLPAEPGRTSMVVIPPEMERLNAGGCQRDAERDEAVQGRDWQRGSERSDAAQG
jgi:hypothetical protein